MQFIFVIVLLVMMILGAEKVLRKILDVEKISLKDTPGAKISAWSQGIFTFLSLLIIPFAVADWRQGMIVFWIVYLTAITVIESFLQRKYIPESREHLVTLAMYPIVLGMLLIMEFMWIEY